MASGLAFTRSMNSRVFFTPDFCEATSTMGWDATMPMGVKSLILYFTALFTRLAMASSLLAPTSRV